MELWAIDFDRLVHADVVNHQPDREPDTGLDKFRQAVDGVMGAVPDSEWTTLNLIEEADLVVCHNSGAARTEEGISRHSNPRG